MADVIAIIMTGVIVIFGHMLLPHRCSIMADVIAIYCLADVITKFFVEMLNHISYELFATSVMADVIA